MLFRSIGPEVMTQVLRVVDWFDKRRAVKFDLKNGLVGGASYDAHGTPLTDAAMHEGGPHSEMAAAAIRDSDARLGELMVAVESAGAFDDTAWVLVADHGMEENDRSVTGDWDVALREAGIPFRDEAYSFLYLGETFTEA